MKSMTSPAMAFLLLVLAVPVSSYATGSCAKLECKRMFTYSKYGADFLVRCMTIKLDNYSEPNQKVVPSNTDYNTCHCTVHTSRAGGVPIDIPWYATRLKDHYYLFPISPDSDRSIDADGNECSPDQIGVGGDFNGSASLGDPDISDQ